MTGQLKRALVMRVVKEKGGIRAAVPEINRQLGLSLSLAVGKGTHCNSGFCINRFASKCLAFESELNCGFFEFAYCHCGLWFAGKNLFWKKRGAGP